MELTLVGTGHVFDIGKHVRTLIEERRPDVVCVELDPVRLRGLRERHALRELEARDPEAGAAARAKHKEQMKKLPMTYRWLAQMQERIADNEGVETGNEMLAAVEQAEDQRIALACIDVEAQTLLARAWKAMTLGERTRFLFGIVFQARGPGGKKGVNDEIAAYEADPLSYLAQFGDKFPNLKRVLIDERDEHMAKRIIALDRSDNRQRIATANQQATQRIDGPVDQGAESMTELGPSEGNEGTGDDDMAVVDHNALLLGQRPLRVVAVVGDGHVEGMLRHLEAAGIAGDRLETVRVKSLRSGDLPENPFPVAPQEGVTDDPNRVGFGFDVTIE